MPEGDTIWNTARELAKSIEGQVIGRSDFRVPRLATVDLGGWLVAASASYGKHLLLRLTRDSDRAALTLHSHLRMDGAWRTFRPGERWTGRPAHLIRVVLHTPAAVAVGYHLHELAIVPTAEESQLLGHLGPDLMGDGWDAAEAVARLAAKPDRPIADALLDQRNLAGIGNVYKAEILFLKGVNPWTGVGAVPDLPAMVDLAHRLLNSNRRRARTTTGSLRRGEATWVFERSGRACRRCGTTIERRTDGDHDRITYWCPHCQPVVAPPPGP